MYRKIAVCLTTLALAAAGLSVSAESPYRSYGVSQTGSEYAAPDVYTAVRAYSAADIGSEDLNAPADFTIDGDGNFYLLDAGNNRIVITDNQLRMTGEIRRLINDAGEEEYLSEPSSIFVTQEAIYVADTGNSRGLRLDRSGRILSEYTEPDDKMYTQPAFLPLKISADSQGNVYMIVENVYQGLVVFGNEGEFRGYYGSPPVTVTLKLLMDRFWKTVMSQEQRSELSQYVPIEYANMTIDSNDFVYAVISNTENHMQQVRKLNALGNNVLSNKDNFGETETIYYQRADWTNIFTDITVENGFLYVLDAKWERVYWLDQDGNRLGTFGTIGEQLGAFSSAVAIHVYDRTVYVMDKAHANITAFSLTEYGSCIYEATQLYRQGNYQEAITPWQKALAMNAHNELAYNGVGEALLKSGDYKGAIDCFRAGGNRERESVAFSYYRSDIIRKNVVPLLLVVLLLFSALVLLTSRHVLRRLKTARDKRRWPKKQGEFRQRLSQTVRMIGNVLVRPLESFQELKTKRYHSGLLVAIILLAWLLIKIFSRQCYGYRFNTYDPDDFSLLIQLAATIIPFLLFCVVNWAVCSIMDGESRFNEILTLTAIEVVPYTGSLLLTTLLSNLLTLDEAMFLQIISVVGIGWSLLLLFQGQRIQHNYTGGKTILAIFLTLCGMAVVLVLLLLIFSLFQQVFYFISTVYSELIFRR